MGRHRIEIEFDNDAHAAEWFFHELNDWMTRDPNWAGIRFTDVSMTPVVDPT